MALIFIKKRRDPIEISNDRARRIKELRFGNAYGIGKADPQTLIDLGDDWAGELGQITAVELTKAVHTRNVQEDVNADWERHCREQLSKPIEERAKALAPFKMAWFVRSGLTQKVPPENVMNDAYQKSLDWFKKNPKMAVLDMSALEPILVKYWGNKKGDASEVVAQKLSTD